ncbi:MAG: septum formation initiator family protein [Clostridia bacterium]|nr:septum formation initiator family protein [Clostridia bacterium]
MPQLSYDYDYLANYESNRKYNNSKRRVARESSRYVEREYRRTSERTREQLRMFMMDGDSAVLPSSMMQRSMSSSISLPSGVIYNKKYTKPEAIELEQTEEELEEKKRARREIRDNIIRNITNVLLFAAIACIALFICYRYSLINEKFNNVEKAKKELLNAQTINEQIQAEIDSETDISYIENYARYQLGMQKPQDSQIMYINVEKQDKIFTPVVAEEEENSWFGNLMEKIANMF